MPRRTTITEPRLTTDLLKRIISLHEDWYFNADQVNGSIYYPNGEDEETMWDSVKYYRPIEEWAKAELEKRQLQAEKREEEKKMESARAMAASIIQMRKERQENNND